MVTVGELSNNSGFTFFANYEPGIYHANFGGVYSHVADELLVDVPTLSVFTKVGAVYEDGVLMTEETSIANLVNSVSWYADAKDLYIRCTDYKNPKHFTIVIGIVVGYATEPYEDPTTGLFYDPRMIPPASISREKDPLFFRKIRYRDFVIRIKNGDMTLYDVNTWSIFGHEFSIYYGATTEAVASHDLIRTGRVKSYVFEKSNLVFGVDDSRRSLQRELPVTTLTSTDYADIGNNDGKYAPIVYGVCRGVPCICVNDDEAGSPANYTFVCADVADHADGINAITQVYVDGEKKDTASTDLTNGKFTIATANYNPGQEVTADISGYDLGATLLENPLDIVKDMLTTYTNAVYNTSYFDTTTWAAETTGKDDINYCVFKKRKLGTIIEDIGASLLEGLDVTPAGKFTWRTHDDEDSPVFQVKAEDWMEMPKVEYTSEESISSARVGYAPHWASGKHLTVIDDDNYNDFIYTFGVPNDKTFDTVLTNKADAQSFAQTLSDGYNIVQIFIKGDIHLSMTNAGYSREAVTLLPGENLDLEIKNLEIRDRQPVYTELSGRVKAELIKIKVDIKKETAYIEARYISDYTTEETSDNETKLTSDKLEHTIRT